MKFISIVICTYNRSRLLKKCLESIVVQNINNIEILVIDNNSQDDTPQVVNKFASKHHNIRYFCEQEIGLSHARNRGIKESKTDWLLYIDDDGMAFPDLVERALDLVKLGDFDCVGGMYFGYYEVEKPKWIPHNFGSKLIYSPILTECPYNVPSGGIVLYRKTILEKLNGFSTNLGMSGNVKDIGEETELQFRASQLNYRIGFDPDLKIHHLIKPEYTNLSWFLVRSYLEGKTSLKINSNENKTILFIKFFKALIGLLFRRFPYNMFQYITKRKYYWQNLIYDSLLPNMLFLGQLIGSFKRNK